MDVLHECYISVILINGDGSISFFVAFSARYSRTPVAPEGTPTAPRDSPQFAAKATHQEIMDSDPLDSNNHYSLYSLNSSFYEIAVRCDHCNAFWVVWKYRRSIPDPVMDYYNPDNHNCPNHRCLRNRQSQKASIN